MIVALTGGRVHTEITEHGEVMENFFRCFLSVPSPASVSSVFTRIHPSLSERNPNAAGQGALRR
jgi:hypothetical protein